MKSKIISLATISSLFIQFPSVGDICKVGTCGIGWDLSIEYAAKEHPQLAEYFNDYAVQKMYTQRDYFKNSTLSKLTIDVYNHWDDVIVSIETAGLYQQFLNSYNGKINHLMYPASQATEESIFVDPEMYAQFKKIIDYHKLHSNDAEFKIFLQDAENGLNLLNGKTNKEARAILFPDTGTCTVQQQAAHYC